jgi:hypothetical protein
MACDPPRREGFVSADEAEIRRDCPQLVQISYYIFFG